jgi:disulfide bond formation protein DsbB
MLKSTLINQSPRRTSLSIGLVALATIIGALIFEGAGYLPCELCLMQRWAYYIGAPLALALAAFQPSWIKSALIVMALLWLGSAGFGVFHSGVEWGWWQGPTTCSGSGAISDGLPDLSKPAVMCNEAAIRIAGLSLAGWNAVISLGLAVLAWRAARSA